ncbi:hypothetical protein K3N28_01215 [Glycomyces sp. TRM65418]|uniref:hypothetical protein n=1 Tax=Glycomyces sp. TRM65418 TaxID=2867006 RepID=UPI001CE4EA0E|nr:hypothetical protein [Glycomyces sp. TRM65418]MCC3761693.1 hypothetical protein [Glycomyces sp. TRM65418]QZD55786.1 hypothetical protein K3N28_01205 [Glycomyces sp. TRM65418]
MWWLAVLVTIVAVVGAYATWTVTRVERLHRRARAAESALLAKLDDRAETVLKFVGHPGFEEVVALALSVVAVPADTQRQRELREYAENDLTRALRELAADPVWSEDLESANRRVALARQIHSDFVRDAVASRSLPMAVLLRLHHRLPRPAYWDIEDPVGDSGSR